MDFGPGLATAPHETTHLLDDFPEEEKISYVFGDLPDDLPDHAAK
jgi:hypothetical protein